MDLHIRNINQTADAYQRASEIPGNPIYEAEAAASAGPQAMTPVDEDDLVDPYPMTKDRT